MLAGESQPPAVHAIAHALNEALGAVGTTVSYTAPAEAQPGGETAALAALVEEMRQGQVEMLVVLGANPVYSAPADLEIAKALDKVPFRVHHGLAVDETAARVHWHLPASHPLESWSDLRAADGTASIVQPLIAPLYHTLSEVEVLDAFARAEGTPKGYDIVRARWRAALGEADFETRWNRAVHDGVVAGIGVRRESRSRRGAAPGSRRPRRSPREGSRSRSGPTLPCSTGASRTSAGCRSCRSRSPRSPGTTSRSSARRRPPSSAASRPSRPRAGT